MQDEKIKYSITAYVPGSICNLRCSYCYVSNCYDEEHLEKPSYDYPLETMIKAFSKKRLNGLAEFTVISAGETLIGDTIIPFIHGLLKEGHVVTVVTNLTLNDKIDQLLDFPKEYLKRLIVKGSFHYLELKRLNKIDDYFNNMKKVLDKGASSYPFMVISKDYMPYLDEIEALCKEKIGVMPHCTPSMVFEEKEDIKRGGKIKTDPECTKEFVEYIDKKFNSKIFDTCVKFLNINVKDIFCYAGEWSFGVALKNGDMFKCHGCKPEVNFYKNLDKLPKLLPIGNNCRIASCALQYNFVGVGLIPEVADIPTFGQMLDRPNLINEEVRNLLDIKLSDIYKQYDEKERKRINKKVNNFLLYKGLRLKTKIMLKLYKHLQKRLLKKGIVKECSI